jgi:single-strand DNA-binding protein
MLNLNRHEVIGHLGSDPTLKYLPNGRPVANMSIATTSVWKDAQGNKREATEWHRIVVWGRRAELVAEHLRRGSYVRVVGPNQTQEYTDRDGIKRSTTKLVAQSVDFLSPRAANDRKLPEEPEMPDEPANLDAQSEGQPAGGDDEISF